MYAAVFDLSLFASLSPNQIKSVVTADRNVVHNYRSRLCNRLMGDDADLPFSASRRTVAASSVQDTTLVTVASVWRRLGRALWEAHACAYRSVATVK